MSVGSQNARNKNRDNPDTVAEWLRRSTRNRLGLSRVGSSPTGVVLLILFSNLVLPSHPTIHSIGWDTCILFTIFIKQTSTQMLCLSSSLFPLIAVLDKCA